MQKVHVVYTLECNPSARAVMSQVGPAVLIINYCFSTSVSLLPSQNSIRHNLSLHDMFVRETSANGKISFWTIHPDANRCLTLDQVFKVSASCGENGTGYPVPKCHTSQMHLIVTGKLSWFDISLFVAAGFSHSS